MIILENCFFQISDYSRAQQKGQISLRPLVGKQKVASAAGAKRGWEGKGEKRKSGEKERESFTLSPLSPSFSPFLPLFPNPLLRLLRRLSYRGLKKSHFFRHFTSTIKHSLPICRVFMMAHLRPTNTYLPFKFYPILSIR